MTLRLLLAVFLSLSTLASAQAISSKPGHSRHAEAVLLAEPAGKDAWTVALRLTTTPGWHTYWRNPGDAGLATSIEWKLPSGWSAGPIEWPVPQLISLPPLMSYGYEGEAWLLTEVKASGPGALHATVRWLECSADTCIPASADFTLALPAAAAPGKDPRIAAARAALPQPWPGTAAVKAEGDADVVELSGGPSLGTLRARFLPFDSGLIDNAAPQLSVHASGGGTWRVKRDANAPALKPGATVDGLLAGIDEAAGKPVGWQVALRVAEVPAPSSASGFSWLLVFGAFAGGLLLNLMPCVLPVLALKVLSLTRSGAGKREGLLFTLGVLVSFWGLAGLLLALRATGEKIGWGFQLQSPSFVILMAALFLLIALNLFGLFEVGLMASGAAGRASGRGGAFWSGVLAVLVASPCTAPFMGSALGVALTASPWVALVLFTSLGLGLAAPYLVLAANPAWLRFVPKPGPWMERLRQFLGFPMLAAALWLVWVDAAQVGLAGGFLLLAALLVLSLAAWLYGLSLQPGRPGAKAFLSIAAVVLAGAALTVAMARQEPQAAAASGQGAWEHFTPDRLAALRAEGKPVFVDFTATWCLSCQVNRRIALEDAAVRRKFQEKGVALLEADWTSRDPGVTAALAGFGRQSVPLYVLYVPGEEPRVLPQLLTPGLVLKALDALPAR
ncbi:MAG: protein-disulfide reductase DsbD family protein [Verrucomicrobium sp.]|nr:protein-disulfide reductase DsbD family protein [Verrucomicrobium sp.]